MAALRPGSSPARPRASPYSRVLACRLRCRASGSRARPCLLRPHLPMAPSSSGAGAGATGLSPHAVFARCEEPLHEMILRPWTTRLENSIRLLSPNLAAPLVHDVISAAGRAELSLQFIRFAYRRAGFRPESATFALLVPILASRRMLNHARCLLLDTMPSFSMR